VPGQIITFYSYKGGTGRSMTLANVAWILASNGKKVLAVDWDLEAPGLHRYFAPFLVDRQLTSSEGVIDFVLDYASNAMTPTEEGQTLSPDWYLPFADLTRYASSLDWPFPDGGTLDFVSAGRQTRSYSTRVNTFDWRSFYDRHGGGQFLEAAKEAMRTEYDYVLIDSRTGVSDTSGICTVQMPDVLVVCFTLNNQSIDGAAAIATSVYERRARSGLRVFPVPMRVEMAEKNKLEARREYARQRFALFPPHLEGAKRDEYWGAIELLYVPYYAYEEVLSTFGDKPGLTTSLLASSERLTGYLTDGLVLRSPGIAEAMRQDVLTRYARVSAGEDDEQRSAAESAFAQLSPEQEAVARHLFTRMVRLIRSGDADREVRAPVSLDEIAWARDVLRVFVAAGVVSITSDKATGAEFAQLASDGLLEQWTRLRGWIDDDRDFLLWRQQLRANLDDWEANLHDSGALLSGAPLAVAQDWRAHGRNDDLTDAERAYIEASLEAERAAEEQRQRALTFEKETRRRARIARAAAVVVTVLGLAFLWGFLFQPFIFPTITTVSGIVRYTAEPSIEVLVPVQGASRRLQAKLDGADLVPKDGWVKANLASLPTGHTSYMLELTDGLVPRRKRIPLDVTYYPRWEVRRFPDALLDRIRTVLRVDDSAVAIVDLRNGNTRQTLRGHSAMVTGALWSPDRKRVLSTSRDGTLRVWEAESGKLIRTLSGHASPVFAAAFSGDGRRALSGSADGKLNVWDVESGKLLRALPGHKGTVIAIAFVDDKHAIAAGDDGTLQLWNLDTGDVVRRFANRRILTLAVSPGGKTFVTGDREGAVTVWNIESGNPAPIIGGDLPITRIAISRDGKWLASGDARGRVMLWPYSGTHVDGENPLQALSVDGPVQNIVFSDDSQLMVTQSPGQAKAWDLAGRREVPVGAGHKREVSAVVFLPDGKTVISGSWDTTLKLWDVDTSRVVRTFTGHTGSIFSLALAPDGQTFLSASDDNTIRLWTVGSEKATRTFTGHTRAVASVAFVPDGKAFVSASGDGTVRVWDVATGKILSTFSGHGKTVNSVAVAPDGKTVASRGDDGTIRLWELASGSELRIIQSADSSVPFDALTFARDGTLLGTGTNNAILNQWRVDTGQIIRTFAGHTEPVWNVSASPDRRWAISAGVDRTLKVWDLRTGQLVRTLEGHTAAVDGVAFSPDGRMAISGSWDTTLKLWWVAVEPSTE
jgi:WD40 repeat protein